VRPRAVIRAMRAGRGGDAAPGDALRAAVPGLAARGRRRPPPVRHDPGGPTLVLSPHLDDAVFSCWSTLTSPGEVTVVNVFTALPPAGARATWDAITGFQDSRAGVQRRLAEDRDALALAGRVPVNLGLVDRQYRRRAPSLSRLLAALAEHFPVAGQILAPAGIGGQGDHRLVRDACLELARGGIPVRLYADVPYAVRLGWPDWVTGTGAVAHLSADAWWAQYLEAVPANEFSLVPGVERLCGGTAAAKLAAMRTYRSQYPALSGGPADVLAHPEILGYEVGWTVVPRGADVTARWPREEPARCDAAVVR
jgi:LmbE family N-acetylglucosaminyl deacetylase